MERLTHRRKSDGAVCANIEESKVLTDFPAFTQKVYERLAAYEDTRLTPEEVKDMMTDWVVWKQAEAEGRLVALPCKMGDTVYMIVTKRARNYTPEFSFVKRSTLAWTNMQRIVKEFGKSVFLTREEAEVALAKEK